MTVTIFRRTLSTSIQELKGGRPAARAGARRFPTFLLPASDAMRGFMHVPPTTVQGVGSEGRDRRWRSGSPPGGAARGSAVRDRRGRAERRRRRGRRRFPRTRHGRVAVPGAGAVADVDRWGVAHGVRLCAARGRAGARPGRRRPADRCAFGADRGGSGCVANSDTTARCRVDGRRGVRRRRGRVRRAGREGARACAHPSLRGRRRGGAGDRSVVGGRWRCGLPPGGRTGCAAPGSRLRARPRSVSCPR